MEQTPAILLRKTPWSETSLIITWLTEQFGAVRTVARGARKPGSSFAGKLDLFFRADISFSLSRRGDLHTLREAGVVSAFDVSRAGSAGFYLAAYFAELSGQAVPSMHPAAEIFDLLDRAIRYLQREPASEKALNYFEREMCRILGVYDAAGVVTSLQGLASLCGGIPRSRAAALSFLAKKNPLALKGPPL
ncbi:MAG: DNA repair protein RecO [Verrucomicrobiota bacterium]